MTKRITTGKRDREKQKTAKRLEKQQRKEIRQQNATKGDMLAYVDANGMLTDTPPDTTIQEEIKLEDIQIATPKKEDLGQDDDMLHGIIDRYNTDKGYGFIKENTKGFSYFFHISQALTEIHEKDHVSFALEQGPNGMQAVQVQVEKA